jgi:hypothetical protein
MKSEGKVTSFVDVAGRCFGYAKIPEMRKPVGLPGPHIRKVEDGQFREFRSDEEKKYPGPGTMVLIKVQNNTNPPLATKWGIVSS